MQLRAFFVTDRQCVDCRGCDRAARARALALQVDTLQTTS